MLSVEDFVSPEKCETIRAVIADVGRMKGLAAIKQECPENIAYEDIIMVIASIEAESA